MQNCMCDSEHNLNCDSGKNNKEDDNERELNTIARSLANQPLSEDKANQLISTLVDHKVVAKKFFTKQVIENDDF